MNGRVELVTQAEYARRRGVAKSAVAKAVAEGRIALIDGKVDPVVANIQWAQNTRARADSGRATVSSTSAVAEVSGGLESAAAGRDVASDGGGADDYQSLRVRRERAQLEAAERDNAREAGRLVQRDAVERGTFDVFRGLRDAIMSAPLRAAAKVVGLTDTREIERVFSAELRFAFDAAEGQLMDRLPTRAKD